MKQLTGLDAAFLALDSPTAYGHVGSVSVLDPPAGGEALTLERLTELIESRLHLVPPFRRRLVEVPFGVDNPYWLEDPDFDIEFHVRELALPAPGDDRQLGVQAARLHARPLDRRRPLWETYLIHGLQGGRQALYTKVHHAAIDGVSGNDLLAALMDTSPEPSQTRGVRKPSPALRSCWHAALRRWQPTRFGPRGSRRGSCVHCQPSSEVPRAPGCRSSTGLCCAATAVSSCPRRR